ncbi:hypothetical protein Pla108_36310 [Botrimarina colliarenosi]|uniref:Uncharacterized protein n=1 Tax=Botrimarina colliarenosi TaxID=2528001 RepID=A0A5C6A4B8_9BACT|nr:hypothetical protein [Botrimarina colliarenosi]TWT94782.1 hypothetical protein Pla108_36310 [Botrimarina colliarenosi]
MKASPNLWLVAIACLAVGVAVGVLVTPSQPVLSLPPIEAHATATAAHDNFVIATGFMEDGTEGLFFLDFLTGDLKATVVNNRGPGFNAYYQYNIANDFNLGAVQNPKYLMVTGLARDQQGRGSNRLAQCILYVVEATSGHLVAYGIPYSRTNQTAGKPQLGTFIPLAKASLRNEFVRDQ